MKKPQVQQNTERRISAGLRLVMVALLFIVQIALVIGLTLVLQQKMVFVYTSLGVLAIVVAVWVYTRPGSSSSYKIGWALLILALPVAGLILYLLWNGNPKHRSDLKAKPYPPEKESYREKNAAALDAFSQEWPNWQRLATYTASRGFALYDDTDWTYLKTGEAYLEHMLAAMEQAEKFIFMEYYIVTRGEIFDRLVEIFRRKREEGVEIKLIFDDFGSMMRFNSEEVGLLRRMGVEVKVFNPVHQYVNRLYFNFRNHRKITCIDGHIAYTGGVNIADEYANIIKRFGYWKDCGVCLTGAGAWGLTREFLRMWERMGGKFEGGYDRYRPAVTVEGKGYCQPFADGPDNLADTAEDIFLYLIGGARHSLRITSPYLAIDEPMIRALCMAGDSGVQVQLMMPGIPDHKFAYLVAETYFGELMRHGVEIYTFTPGLLHGKTVLVDDEAAVVGTVNMDYRSFHLHYECGTVLYGEKVKAMGLSEDMDEIIARSRRVTVGAWKARPFLRKLTGMFLRLFAMWM